MTDNTVTPNSKTIKKKIGEIGRLQLFINKGCFQVSDISNKTGVSERTIKNIIYENMPIGGKFLRALHLKCGVSIDWILTGAGQMMAAETQGEDLHKYSTRQNPRTQRIFNFINDWMTYASADEQAWLETDLKFKLSQYQEFLTRIDRQKSTD